MKVGAKRVCIFVDVVEQAEIPVFRTCHGHPGPCSVYMEPQRGNSSDYPIPGLVRVTSSQHGDDLPMSPSSPRRSIAPDEVVPTVATTTMSSSGMDHHPRQGPRNRAHTENKRIHAGPGIFFQRPLERRATKGIVILGRDLERTDVQP